MLQTLTVEKYSVWCILNIIRCMFGCMLMCIVVMCQVTTTIGFGSPNKANSYSVHGAALGAKEVDATRQNLGWPYEPFFVPEEVKR